MQSKAVKNETPVSNPISESESLPSVSASTLRAYNNIPFKGKFIPKSEFNEWLKSTGFMRTNIIDDLFARCCDATSQLSERAFEFIKNCQKKGQVISNSSSIIEGAKENGRINYRALDLIDGMIEKQRGYRSTNFRQILEQLKDKDGNFNESVIELFEKDVPTFKQYMTMRPDVVFNAIKDGEGRFSPEAVGYFAEHLENKEKVQDIISNLYTAKNPDGTIDIDNIETMRSIKETFGNGNFYVRDIVRNAPKEQRQNIINLSAKIKDDKQFESIMRNMQTLKLEFNEENIGFAKKLSTITRGNDELLKIIMSKTKLIPETLTEEHEQLLTRVCQMFTPDELKIMLDTAIYKAGDKIGQFSFENLNRYNEIFTSRNRRMDIIQMLSSRFALEEDDQAIRVFHKLYTMEWPGNNFYPDKVDEGILDFITSLGTMERNNIPKRPMHKPLLDSLEKLMDDKYATQSKAVFQNFVDCPDLEAVEKFKRINLEEAGLKPEQITAMFQTTDETKLLKFKEFIRKYMQEHNLKEIDIATNPNIKGRLEITSGTEKNKNVLLYDFNKFEPITNIHITEDYRFITKTQRDYGNNTETTLVFRKKNQGYYQDLEVLNSQTIKHFDDNGNEIYRDIMEQSPIKGVLNLKKVYPDGREENIVNARITADGHELIEKNMESLDGTRTIYRFEKDNAGNTITDYKIVDKNGKTLMNQSSTYETLSENHYRTSKNGIAYDVKFENSSIIVTCENTGKTRILNLSKLTEGTQHDITPLLKQFPGDELFKIDETGLKNISYHEYKIGASFSPDNKAISIGMDFEDLGIILHEFGHAKDRLLFSEISEQINNQPELLKIYNEEREAFRNNFSESQLDMIGYFTSDHHYTGGLFGNGNPLIEGIAETNTLLNTHPYDDIQSLRAQYWQQYFPKTIASIAQLII